MNEKIASAFHNIQLELTGWDEPNNGRMLHVANIIINGKNENEKYFANWNRLNEKLDRFSIESLDGNFLFVPAESDSFLINTKTLEKITLPYKGLSTVLFLGNFFWKNYLFVLYRDEILVFDLTTLLYQQIVFDSDVIWASISDSEKLEISCYEGRSNVQNTKYFDFISIF